MSEREILSAPVCSVTVLEDRAMVRREGRAALVSGRARLRVEGVAPVVADKTLQVRLEGAELQDARIHRRWLARDEDRKGKHAELVRALREIDERIEAHRATIGRRERELKDLYDARALLVAETSDDVAWGRADLEASERALRGSFARDAELRQELADLHHALGPLEKERGDLARQEVATRSPSSTRACWIDLDVVVAADADVAFTLEYLVPGACWRPQHRATLKGQTLKMESDACVWQRTGEDWTDAELRFSTERPSLGVEPPSLSADVLRTKKKAEVVEVEAREQTIETSGLGRDATVAQELPGVDDGGEVRLLVAPHPASVPSDGRPHRVHLGSYETEAEVELVAMPEKAALVIVRSTQTHRGDAPLLAGPVDLVRESGPVGRTNVLFVAAGERFELGWGPEPAIRVHREAERLDEKSRLLSSWIRIPHRVELKLSNLGNESMKVEVTERIPVSEVPQVTIEIDGEKTSGSAEADDDGLVKWTVTLPPHGRETVKLAYTLAKKEGVEGV